MLCWHMYTVKEKIKNIHYVLHETTQKKNMMGVQSGQMTLELLTRCCRELDETEKERENKIKKIDSNSD